ncbi:MAG: hypothetical protein ACFB2Z_03885 [Maricaulaceae bacterium]
MGVRAEPFTIQSRAAGRVTLSLRARTASDYAKTVAVLEDLLARGVRAIHLAVAGSPVETRISDADICGERLGALVAAHAASLAISTPRSHVFVLALGAAAAQVGGRVLVTEDATTAQLWLDDAWA